MKTQLRAILDFDTVFLSTSGLKFRRKGPPENDRQFSCAGRKYMPVVGVGVENILWVEDTAEVEIESRPFRFPETDDAMPFGTVLRLIRTNGYQPAIIFREGERWKVAGSGAHWTWREIVRSFQGSVSHVHVAPLGWSPLGERE